MKFNKRELIDITIAWLGISLAFFFLLRGLGTLTAALTSLGTVGLGFVFHELAHKLVAQKYHFEAGFRADYKMILFAVFLAFAAGFVFAAPGAVVTYGRPSTKQHGHIAIAGPTANIILAILFFIGTLVVGGTFFKYGMLINGFLALFNMIPFGPFDGRAAWRWSKGASIAVMGLGIIAYLGGLFA
ncbi:MAG: metalloprotease [Candidatus Woesearchaeota archaeon]